VRAPDQQGDRRQQIQQVRQLRPLPPWRHEGHRFAIRRGVFHGLHRFTTATNTS
jgi:hypothetical protein